MQDDSFHAFVVCEGRDVARILDTVSRSQIFDCLLGRHDDGNWLLLIRTGMDANAVDERGGAVGGLELRAGR